MESGLNFSFNEDQEAIRVTIDRFCTQHSVVDIARQSGQPFPRALWRELAGLGPFYPAAPGHSEAGGALEVCAISETLGHHLFPGPIAATYLAIQLLEPDEATGLLDGGMLVSLSSAGSTLLPWGTEASLFLVAGTDEISRAHTPQAVEAEPTLGGETWGRATLTTTDRPLAGACKGFIIGRISTAAYLASAAWHLLTAASDYAATRRQFGKTLGEFQAVAHPLADCAIGLTAAQTLVRAAACDFDRASSSDGDLQQVDSLAAGALLSAQRAGLNTAYVCHQVFAGIGITLEGPAFHISRRIRQLVSTPPGGVREQNILLAAAGLGVSV